MTTNGVQLTSLNIIIFILWVSHMSITEDETTSDIDFQTILAFCSLILTSCQCYNNKTTGQAQFSVMKSRGEARELQ